MCVCVWGGGGPEIHHVGNWVGGEEEGVQGLRALWGEEGWVPRVVCLG